MEIFTSTETMVDHLSPTHPTHPTHPAYPNDAIHPSPTHHTHPTHPAYPNDAIHPSPTHPTYACRMLQLTPLSLTSPIAPPLLLLVTR